ncbi:RDD family protein [Microbacterium azadirachtae]|uniref:RDD family protein n=1 Tax=Microbacterium azadirachtae TaxID=582680 RepID=UPI003F751AFD
MSLSNDIWEIPAQTTDIEGLDAQGRPDPAYAQAIGLVPARAGMRVMATVLELIVALLVSIPGAVAGANAMLLSAADPNAFLARKDLIWILLPLLVSFVLMFVFTLVQLILHGLKGVTLGKAAFGIRTVNVRTLEKPGFWRGAVVRYLILAVSFAVPLIGPLLVVALSPLFDAERRGRGWPDRAAATWLVDVRRGLNPYDAKRMRIARKQITTEVHEAAPVLPSLATPVDRDAPAVYVPTGRFSGGVVGAHRAAAPTPAVSASAPAVPAPVAQAPAAPVPAAPPPAGTAEPAVEPPATAAAPAAWQPPEIAPIVGAPAPAAVAPAAAPVPDAPRAVLVIDNGERVEVRTTTLLGRAPAAGAGDAPSPGAPTGESEPQLVRVADETRSVSKTHLAILLSRRGVVAVDRGSTNGSSIVREGAELPLTPGHPAELRAGDVLRFGDRSLRVEQA